MTKSFSPSTARRPWKSDALKIIFMLGVLLGTFGIFFLTPGLSSPSLLGIIIAMLLSPAVTALERRNYPRTASILFLFIIIGVLLAALGIWATQSVTAEWDSFREQAPKYFDATVSRLQALEIQFKQKFPFLEGINPTESLMGWGEKTGHWFIVNGPQLLGDAFTWLLIVPFISFVLLNDGRKMRKRFFDLIPNRIFENTFMITTQVMGALSDYFRAKLLEAFLVGALISGGLYLIGAPYSLVLGVIAGVTNIIPYVGPIIGAIPGVLVPFFDPTYSDILIPVFLVYLIVNLIDMVLVFPLIVAHLVNLHPLILIAVVILGQQVYGFVGMLISIPIASVIKVFVHEIYSLVYHPGRAARLPLAHLNEIKSLPKKRLDLDDATSYE